MTKVTVYSTLTCPHCDRLKSFLEKNNIEYEDHNVAENKEKAKEMIKKTGQRGVPVAEVEDGVVVGFNKKKLKDLLDI